MVQYLHSMEYRTETGGVNPTDGERVSQIAVSGADRDQNREGFVPAQYCSALSSIKVKKQQQKDWGGADRF